MKQAKFLLAMIVVLAMIGGALAFKSNKGIRINRPFYSLTTSITTPGGQPVRGCFGRVDIFYTCDVQGSIQLTTVSCATTIATTCVAAVRING